LLEGAERIRGLNAHNPLISLVSDEGMKGKERKGKERKGK
jgi:hypothetical protein